MTQHKHAALIAEWIKDTSREVLCRPPDHYNFKKDIDPLWVETWEYKFAFLRFGALALF